MKNKLFNEYLQLYGDFQEYKLLEVIEEQMQKEVINAEDVSIRKVLEGCLFRSTSPTVDYSYILHKKRTQGIYRDKINWKAIPNGERLIWKFGIYFPSGIFQNPCTFHPVCHPNGKKVKVFMEFYANKLSKSQVVTHPEFLGCSYVIPLDEGIIWRNKKNEVHVFCIQGKKTAIAAFYKSVWKGVNGIEFPVMESEIPYSMLRNKVLEKQFWIFMASQFGKAAGWSEISTNIDGVTYNIDYDEGIAIYENSGGRRIYLTKRALIEFVTFHC